MDWPEPPVDRATEVYSQMPAPPRILIPPAACDGNAQIHAYISNQSADTLQANSFANTEFLSSIDFDGSFRNSEPMAKEWKYEWRREAQQILPFLYLGPASVVRDALFLERENITMVMACRDRASAMANLLLPRAAADLGLECVNIDVAGNQGLIAAFPQAIDAINSHLSARFHAQSASASSQERRPSVPGKVLVFCETGNERSTAVILAYIMAMYSIDFIKAFRLIQSHRFCISFDDPARQLLKTYDSILQAKRDVAKEHTYPLDLAELAIHGSKVLAPALATSLQEPQSLKRSHQDALIDTDGGSQQGQDSHEVMDLDRFVGRSGPAPFYDSS